MDKYPELDLSREHEANEQTLGDEPTPKELDEIVHRMGKFKPEDQLNCGACGYEGCLEHARAVYAGIADSEMCLPHTIEQLREAYGELEVSHRSLEEAKEALERSGRLASMGQLAAGIAHEVNNPLGTLLLHANLLLEECGDDTETREDLETIVDQANRCKRIISGLLNFARQSRVLRQPTDVGEVIERTIRTTPVAEGIEVILQNHLSDPVADIDPDQMVQVFTNLITNAQQAMPEGGTLTVELSDEPDTITVRFADTGMGILPEHMPHLFDPFFSTKPLGMGTGLGLAVTHGIVKMHKGNVTVESDADASAAPTWTALTVTLPRREETEADSCRLLVTSVFMLDSCLFCFGYHAEARWLGNEVRYVETTVSGLVVCLVCYPPFNSVTGAFLGSSNGDMNILFRGDLHHPITWGLRGLAVLALLLLTSASCSLFTKASNLTNRGIVHWGPYRWMRHPGYVGKNLFWLLTLVPLFCAVDGSNPAFPWKDHLLFCLGRLCGFVGWCSIYVLRGLTEERLLMSDPDYRAYCQRVRYRFIPGVV